KEWGTFSIITIDSHSSDLHAKVVRPIILNKADEALWLDPAIDDMSTLYSMMKSYTDDTLSIHRVSSKINSTKLNTPDLITPIDQ
ncbi:SOS response-associated peptidase family protein, partial [Candidatus Saccharibacteria bacterium]|nr:SOS response-associated peptidase family protein [Candidatus Saccharibacteria bacterium]